MAAKNTREPLTAEVWTEISGNDITEVTLQNRGKTDIALLAIPTLGTPPVLATEHIDGLVITPNESRVKELLADMFLGVALPVRLFALSLTDDGSIFISHA